MALPGAAGADITELVIALLIQLAVILAVAKLAGELALRVLKVPPVLAELAAGIIIGPYALGGVEMLGVGPLFPLPERASQGAGIPVSDPLFALAQIGSIVLLFAVGLEVNLRQFLRYAAPATAVATGATILHGPHRGGSLRGEGRGPSAGQQLPHPNIAASDSTRIGTVEMGDRIVADLTEVKCDR